MTSINEDDIMDILVLLRLLFDVTYPIGELLEVVLVVGILLLQFYLGSSKHMKLLIWELNLMLPCCFFALI